MGIFTVAHAVRLLALTVFVYWEYYVMSPSKKRAYDEMLSKQHPWYVRIPGWVFPFLWCKLKALMVASAFFFMEYSLVVPPAPTDEAQWPFQAAFWLFAVLTLASKAWTPLFFQWCQRTAAFWLAVVLALHAIAIQIVLCYTAYNYDGLWWIPAGLWFAPAAWYCFAALISAYWAGMFDYYEEHHHRRHHRGHRSHQIAHRTTTETQVFLGE
jgi:tryptophan-rich sensory protein